MASTAYNAATVTKVEAGGSGDNYIADGYIKSVEKIWIDSWTNDGDTSTHAAIAIAKLPDNKKITSIEIQIETLATQSTGNIGLGTADDEDKFMSLIAINHNLTYTTINWPSGINTWDAQGQLDVGKALQYPGLSDGSDIVLVLSDWTNTGGTVTSIVRYT